MKEFSPDNYGPAPEKRSFEEVSIEKLRELVHNLREMPHKAKLIAAASIAMSPWLLKPLSSVADKKAEGSAVEVSFDGHTLENQPQVDKMMEIIRTMPESFADEREAIITELYNSCTAFLKENALKNSSEAYPLEELSESINNEEIGRQDTVQTEDFPEKGEQEYLTCLCSEADLLGINPDPSNPSLILWTQNMRVMRVAKPKNAAEYDMNPEGEAFEILGSGKTEYDALLDARFRAVIEICSKADADPAEREQKLEEIEDIIDKSSADTAAVFSSMQAAAFIYSREEISKEEIKDEYGSMAGMKVVIRVQPGKIERKDLHSA